MSILSSVESWFVNLFKSVKTVVVQDVSISGVESLITAAEKINWAQIATSLESKTWSGDSVAVTSVLSEINALLPPEGQLVVTGLEDLITLITLVTHAFNAANPTSKVQVAVTAPGTVPAVPPTTEGVHETLPEAVYIIK